MNLTSLENCIDTEHPKLYTDMTAGEFLDERPPRTRSETIILSPALLPGILLRLFVAYSG